MAGHNVRRTLAFMTLIVIGSAAAAAVPLTGVNLAAADFGENELPGTYNIHYTYPTAAEVDYYVDKGVNTFRLPFRWERLQRSAGAALDATELARLDAVVDYATAQGAQVLLDPHNYARYYGDVIGSGVVSNADFADFWSRLANQYGDNPRVMFGLVNEPNSMPTEQWLSAANEAIAAIRATGANNTVFVPGNAWSGAHSWNQSWYGTSNAQVMTGIVDPANNYVIEVHQYLNGNSSGADSGIVSETIGQERLVDFTEWARANNLRAFLGEFAVANSTVGDAANQIGDEAINHMLDYVEANNDVWLGWTWWAGGPWWGEYRFTIEPQNLSGDNPTDRPVMNLIEPRLVGISELPGDFNGDGAVNVADYTTWRDNLGSADDLHGNGINDGAVNVLDDMLWKQQFGQSAPTSSARQSVPEPAGRALATVLLTVSLLIRNRTGNNQIPGSSQRKSLERATMIRVSLPGAIMFALVSYSFAQENGDVVKLFNGENLEGWHMDVPALDENPDARQPFVVRDGLLVSLGTPGGHLITDEEFDNYRLDVEYRFAGKPGNCGVLVHSSKPRRLYGMFPQSIEVQMMHKNAGDFWCIGEDIVVENMVERRGPKERWGVDDKKARRIKNLTDDSENPAGEWNSMTIECVGDEVKVWVNGDVVNHGTNATAGKGAIALQAEGSEVEFRRVDLTPIKHESLE